MISLQTSMGGIGGHALRCSTAPAQPVCLGYSEMGWRGLVGTLTIPLVKCNDLLQFPVFKMRVAVIRLISGFTLKHISCEAFILLQT
jgi:hypothetical protein